MNFTFQIKSLGWLIVIGFVVSLISGYGFFRQHMAISKGQAVEVKILEARVAKYKSAVQVFGEHEYKPVINYAYTVNGKQYTSAQYRPVALIATPPPEVLSKRHSGPLRIRFTGDEEPSSIPTTPLEIPLREMAKQTLKDYPVDSIQTGYINPDNPAESYLVKDYNPTLIWVFGISMFATFLLAGLSLLGGGQSEIPPEVKEALGDEPLIIKPVIAKVPEKM